MNKEMESGDLTSLPSLFSFFLHSKYFSSVRLYPKAWNRLAFLMLAVYKGVGEIASICVKQISSNLRL